MADSDRRDRPRASLRGKGWEILTGSPGSRADEDYEPTSSTGEVDEAAAPPLIVPGSIVRASDEDGATLPAPIERPLFEPAGPFIGQIQPPNGVDEIEDLAEPREGGLVAERPLVDPPPATILDPFWPIVPRQLSTELFDVTAEPDGDMMARLIDDARLRDLWNQIDALQEELIQQVENDRCDTDVHQKELLHASSLLLASRANYDDARAVVYRIRADLNRRRKVEQDIQHYRPALLRYYLVWGALWVILVVARATIIRVGEDLGSPGVAIVYYPVMFGVLGAIVSGYLTLDRHTTHLRDFDPLHVSWYLFNPLLGGVMGLMMLLLYAVINQDVLWASEAEPMELAIVWLLCAVAGMNQNAVLRQMYRMLDRLGSGTSGGS